MDHVSNKVDIKEIRILFYCWGIVGRGFLAGDLIRMMENVLEHLCCPFNKLVDKFSVVFTSCIVGVLQIPF